MTDPHIPAAPDAVPGGSDAAATPPLTPPTPGAAPSAPAAPPAPPYAAPAYQPPTYQAPAYPPPAYPGAAPQPGYAPPAGYAAPPAPGYGAPYGYAPARKTNTLAIVSMIAAIRSGSGRSDGSKMRVSQPMKRSRRAASSTHSRE